MRDVEKGILRIKVTRNITYLEARKVLEQQPEITYSKIVQSAAMKKPETKATETYFDEKDFNITASSKVIIPTKYKQNKQAKSTATTKTSVSTSQPSTSKTNNEKPRARSKTRTSNRDNSKSPKTRQKEKPTVKLTRVQDQPVKTSNKYDNLESMET